MVLTTRQKHQRSPLHLNLSKGNQDIEQVRAHRLLGVIIDEKFTFHRHVNSVIKKVSRNLYLMSKLWHYVPTEALLSFFYAHCLSHINYASTIWCNTDNDHINKLNRLHKRAVKLIYRAPNISTMDKYKHLNILTLNNQFLFNACTIVFKQCHALVPVYLQELLPRQNARTLDFAKPPSTSRLNITQAGFVFSSVSAWNSLPLNCKSCSKVGSFKQSLRKHLLTQPTVY